MKEKEEIYMDFKRAKEAAKELDEIVDQMSQVANYKLNSTMNELSASWDADEKRKFQEKEEAIKNSMNHNIQQMKTLANKIKNNARRIYEAELRAYEIMSKKEI